MEWFICHLIAVMYILPAVTNAHSGLFPWNRRSEGDLDEQLYQYDSPCSLQRHRWYLLWKLGIEALPYSYLAGWIAMLLVETPLMLRIYRKK